jgi:hypothetical protein
MPFEFSPKVPIENSPLRYASIASKATRRFDVGEEVKIKLDDCLQCLGGGAVAKAFTSLEERRGGGPLVSTAIRLEAG